MQEDQKPNVPKWLSELQQRSWEPEILLSGIVLYGMFKVPDMLDGFLAYFKLNIFGNSQDIDNLVALFKMGIYWLITGLIMHLICRGVWIGMVGLSYTFPSGIRLDKLNYQPKFKAKVEKTPSYEHIVTKLEKISSSLFSVSFMLFMSLIGGYCYFFVLLFLPFTIFFASFGFDEMYVLYFQIYIFLLLGIGIIGLIDFLSLGYFRKFKWFEKIFWPIHVFIAWLTFSKLYRPIYYGVVTNFNKWAFFSVLTVFTVVSIMGAANQTSSYFPGDNFSRLTLWGISTEHTVYPGWYDDQSQDKPSNVASIPSDVISGDVLKFFIVSNIRREKGMLEHTPLDSLKEVYPDTSDAVLNLLIVKNYFNVVMNKDTVDITRWFYHYKYSAEQRGYLAYIDISDIQEGQHLIKVSEPSGRLVVGMPFYRDATFSRPIAPRQEDKSQGADFQPKPFGIRE